MARLDVPFGAKLCYSPLRGKFILFYSNVVQSCVFIALLANTPIFRAKQIIEPKFGTIARSGVPFGEKKVFHSLMLTFY